MRLGNARLGSSTARLGSAGTRATGPIYIDYEYRAIATSPSASLNRTPPATVSTGASATIDHPEPGER